MDSVAWDTERGTGWDSSSGRVEACLNEVLALGLCDERLELGSGEGIDKTGLRDDEEKDLSTSEGGKLVGLKREMAGQLSSQMRMTRVGGRERDGKSGARVESRRIRRCRVGRRTR